MQAKIKQFSLFSILLLLIISGCGLSVSSKQKESAVTLSEAIEIGKKELKKVGYPHWNEELIVKADDNNTIWKEHISSSPSVLENGDIKEMHLEEKEYWAIHYWPKKFVGTLTLGGDAFVFIDRSNGKVLGVRLGE